MLTKAKQTSDFIIQTVAPIFNKNGYAATSLSDITKATGLTKGAIYGNFKNKEELAIATFNFTVKNMLRRITDHQSLSDSPIEKLYLITDFYRNYYNYSQELGGCPVLNMGVDSKHQNPSMFQHVKYTIHKIQNNVAKLIEEGKLQNEIKLDIDTILYSKRLYTMIIGAIFMTHTIEDNNYLLETMDQIDQMIHKELKK
ncbi:TetR/AcrR family transcriptional regulator [Aquimarina sp. AD10]|uniref:TetR/AcrR family transcriptional regulator n=1 Tax=Aquimarina sp. AD10 TaxID=1714849 RepID=UPI000E49CBF7|nr:TetR/AcrR family transcriptional regulator [Aquimarina sp. AD10]AXT63529.1 TetR/AcrR family transcriptional regulator [Aquimarina sp. AD10]RKM99753.1 TetR family transcriptional regulator [Aquimarina sp. AD10]